MDFSLIKKAVAANIATLSKEKHLFTVDIDRDKIIEAYLSGFASEDERQEHNCNCCKSFLRNYGGVVAIVDNKIVSIWEGVSKEAPLVNLAKYIKGKAITGLFLVKEINCGTDRSYDPDIKGNWQHFHFKALSKFVSSDIGAARGASFTDKGVFERALKEFSQDSVEVILELIAQNGIYRGAENKALLEEFLKRQKQYAKLRGAQKKSNFAWVESANAFGALVRIRNGAIGTLLIDINKGTELDDAVRKYESVVAPANYKRTSAVVTKAMAAKAKAKIAELGLEGALERRYAEATDLSIENLLFFDKPKVLKDVFEQVVEEGTVSPKSLEKVTEVGIDKFLSDIVPKADSIEILLENSHLNNFCSMLTSDDTSKLFKWDNQFSWYYTGGITDSIKERVKSAGGSVDGKLRASLSWSNSDDLDIHCWEPCGNEVYFANRLSASSGARLDVDMNAGGRTSLTPVENIIWKDKVPNGKYKVGVHQFSRRGREDQGYSVQIEFCGQIFDFGFDRNIGNSIGFEIKNGQITFNNGSKSKPIVQTKWGLNTNSFHKVKAITTSPNFWGDKPTGNKHFMFMLEGAKNDESPRSIFNEFLRQDLNEHRKVFEMVGGALKVQDSDEQLSGLGFSSTIRNAAYVKVKGKFDRVIKVNF